MAVVCEGVTYRAEFLNFPPLSGEITLMVACIPTAVVAAGVPTLWVATCVAARRNGRIASLLQPRSTPRSMPRLGHCQLGCVACQTAPSR